MEEMRKKIDNALKFIDESILYFHKFFQCY